MEKKTTPLLITGTDEVEGIVETVFAVFGNVDGGKDMMHPGSFKRTFQQRASKVRILDQHRTDSVMRALGVPLELRELSRAELPTTVTDDYPEATGGAYAKVQFLINTPEGKGAFERLRAGAVDEWSFGYDAVVKEYETTADGDRIRHLREVKLFELGPVLFAMNAATTTVSAKSGDALTKRAIPYQELPLASRTRRWSANAATRRVREWAGYDPSDDDAMNWSQYRRAFLWYDADDAEMLASYKLPYADVIDGELTAIPRALFAATAAIQGARSEPDIPDAEVTQVRRILSRWYTRMAEEFDDEAITAPWDKAEPTVTWPGDDPRFDDKAFNLTTYVREITSLFYTKFPDTLSDGRDSPRIIYYVQEVWDSFLVVEQGGNQDGNGLYRVNYTAGEDGELTFAAREDWQPGKRVFVTIGNGMQTSSKAGRILSQRNATRVLTAISTLQELLVEAGVLEALADDDNEGSSQEEAAGPGPSQTSTSANQPDAAASPGLLAQIELELADITYTLVGT